MLKLKQEEEKFLGKLNNILLQQRDEYNKLNNQTQDLNIGLKSHYDKLNQKINDYISNITLFEDNISQGSFDELQKLKKEYFKHLKTFEMKNDFIEQKNNLNIEQRKLDQMKYFEMNTLHKEYKEKEIELLKNYFLNNSRNLHDLSYEILESQKLYEQMYKHYIFRRNELAQYQDGICQLKNTEEAFYENKNNLYESRVKGAISSIAYKFETEIKPDLLKVFDAKLSMLNLDFSKYFFNTNFSIAKNHKFLDGIYTTKQKESLSVMKFIMHKFNNDDPFLTSSSKFEEEKIFYSTDPSNKEAYKKDILNIDILEPRTYELKFEENKKTGIIDYENIDMIGKEIYLTQIQRENLKKNFFSNYVKLGKYAKKFNDSFLKNLVEITLNKKIENVSESFIDKKYSENFVTKTELLRYFEQNRYDVLYEVFYNYDIFRENKVKKKTYIRFLFSHLLSELGSFWLDFFNPDFSITDPNTKDFVNQLKALNYIIYHIKNEDYAKAFTCYANIHPDNFYINGVKDKIEILAKNQIFCEIVENHIDGSEYYRDRNI